MKIRNNSPHLYKGFTLVEIIISILLLSLLVVGSFRTFHLVQANSNQTLSTFKQLQLDRLNESLAELRNRFTTITIAAELSELKCINDSAKYCQ